MRRTSFIGFAFALFAAASGMAFAAQDKAVASRDVNSPALRQQARLAPGKNLLFNGWGITPAGDQIPLSCNLPLKMVVSPDGRVLLTGVCGFGGTGLIVGDIAQKKKS